MADKKATPAKPAAAAKPSRTGGSKIDIATMGGVVLALAGIVGGLLIEGGSIGDILRPTAAMIVFGGTIGAVMITMPLNVLIRGVRALVAVFFEKQQAPQAMIEEIIAYATKARKNGIVSLEQEAADAAEPFLRKALSLAVDGTDLQEIRKMMELEIAVDEQRGEAAAKVFEAAGGYAPTVGIIGAVMGLIQVMKNLANIDEVGRGIATAFVATIYGVGAANIFFLPAGNKIKARAHSGVQMKELMLEGVAGIVEGLNPKLIRTKLEAYVEPAKPAKAKESGAKDKSKSGAKDKSKGEAKPQAEKGAAPAAQPGTR